MGGFATQKETKEQVTFTLPSGLARQVTDKASAMHVSVDAAAAVLLTYGLKAQEESEREIAQLVAAARQAESPEHRESAIDKLGESIFGK
jgi:hypothetical protein